jgi:hypothetical protein
MIFNLRSIFYVTITIAVVGLTSCTSEDKVSAKPVISGLELGKDNSHKAKIGDELHMDAEIVAEGLIKLVEVEMHLEGATGEHIDAEFPKYNGQKNADFHEHIEIPATAKEGEYHFHIKVVDQEGQTTEVEADVILEK